MFRWEGEAEYVRVCTEGGGGDVGQIDNSKVRDKRMEDISEKLTQFMGGILIRPVDVNAPALPRAGCVRVCVWGGRGFRTFPD